MDKSPEQHITAGEEKLLQSQAEDPQGTIGDLMSVELDDMIAFADRGHVVMSPVFLEHEDSGHLIIRHSHGFFSLVEHVNGARALLYSHDYHMFDPVVYDDKKERMNGFFLNADNASDVDVVYAREKADGEYWALDMVNKRNSDLTEDLRHYGYLRRVSENMYVSGAVAYVIEPLTDKAMRKHEKKMQKQDADWKAEEQLYTLRCYTTSGKGDDFQRFDEDYLKSRWGKVLNLSAEKSFSTRDQVEDYIANDFVVRAELVMSNQHPGQVGYMKKDPSLESYISPHRDRKMPQVIFMLKAALGGLVNSIYLNYSTTRGKPLARAGKAIGLAAAQWATRGIRYGAIKFALETMKPVLLPLVKIFKRQQTAGLFHASQNVDFRFWDKNLDPIGMKDTDAHPIDPYEAAFCRFLHENETKARPVTGMEKRKTVREDMPAQNLLDVYGAPVGSILEQRRINNRNVLYIRQPDGIEIYNLIGNDAAYVRRRKDFEEPKAQKMHRKMRELFDKNGAHVRVWLDKSNPDDVQVRVRQMNVHEFLNELAQETENERQEEVIRLHDNMCLKRAYERAERKGNSTQDDTLGKRIRRQTANATAKAVVTTADALGARLQKTLEQDNSAPAEENNNCIKEPFGGAVRQKAEQHLERVGPTWMTTALFNHLNDIRKPAKDLNQVSNDGESRSAQKTDIRPS